MKKEGSDANALACAMRSLAESRVESQIRRETTATSLVTDLGMRYITTARTSLVMHLACSPQFKDCMMRTQNPSLAG